MNSQTQTIENQSTLFKVISKLMKHKALTMAGVFVFAFLFAGAVFALQGTQAFAANATVTDAGTATANGYYEQQSSTFWYEPISGNQIVNQSGTWYMYDQPTLGGNPAYSGYGGSTPDTISWTSLFGSDPTPTVVMDPSYTIVGTGTDPASATVAPGSGIRDAGSFDVYTSEGTDGIYQVGVDLGSAYTGLASVVITNTAGTVTYFTFAAVNSQYMYSNGGTGITATTSQTEYRIRVTPKTHANMAAVPGASYSGSPQIFYMALGYVQSGTDSNFNTLTIDNASPNNATSTTSTAGNAAVTLNWTASSSTDINQTLVLRWLSSSAGAEVPLEGASYTLGDAIDDSSGVAARVVCLKTTSSASAAHTEIHGTGGDGDCETSALTNGQAYSYKIFQKDSRGNYSAGVTTNLTNKVPAALYSTTSSQTGNWNLGTTWGGACASSCTAGTHYPSTSENVTIANGHTVTLTGAQGAGSVTVNTTGVLVLGSNTLTLSGTGTPLTITGTFTPGTGTVQFTGATATIASTTYYNLTTGGTGTYTLGGNVTVSSVATISTSATLALSSYTLILSGSGTPLVATGTLTGGTGTVRYTSTTGATVATGVTYQNLEITPASGTPTFSIAAANFNVAGNLTVNGSSGTIFNVSNVASALDINGSISVSSGNTFTAPGSGKTFTIAGDFTNAGTYTHSSGTITFDAGASGKEITSGGSTLNHVTFNNASGGWTLQDNLTIAGALTLTNGTLHASTRTITLSTSGTPITRTSGVFDADTSTVKYTSGSGITALASSAMTGTSRFNNLTIEGTGAFAAGINYELDGALTITSGTFSSSGYTATFNDNSSISNATTLTFGNLTTDTNADVTGNASFTVNGVFTNGSGADYTSSSGIVTMSNGSSIVNTGNDGSLLTFNDLTIAASATVTANTSYTVGGVLTISGLATLAPSSGTITLSGTGTPFVINGTFTPTTTQVVKYTGSNANVAATTYQGLTLGGTGVYAMPATTITLKENLIITSGAEVTKGVGTVVLSGTSAQTITDNTASKQDIGNVQISVSEALMGSNLKMSTLTIDSAKIFNVNGTKTLTLTGNGSSVLVATGTFTASTGTVEFASAATTGTTIPVITYNNLTVNKALNTFTAGGNLTLKNFTVTAGIFDTDDTNDYDLTLSGNFTNTGTFNANESNVTFNDVDTTSVIAGATTFHDLTVITPRKHLEFTADQTFTVTGELTITGTSGNPIFVESTTTTPWIIYHQGTEDIEYLSLKYASCHASSTEITLDESAVNRGSNGACWDFVSHSAPGGQSGNGSSTGSNDSGQGGGGTGGGASVQATATATVGSGAVQSVEIVEDGSGYTLIPLICFADAGSGNETGATATATISGGAITGITVNTGGSGYTGTTVVVIGSPGSTGGTCASGSGGGSSGGGGGGSP